MIGPAKGWLVNLAQFPASDMKQVKDDDCGT
jgi:hypothetical protein